MKSGHARRHRGAEHESRRRPGGERGDRRAGAEAGPTPADAEDGRAEDQRGIDRPALRRVGVDRSIRASLAFRNTREDADVFLKALRRLPRA